MSGSLEGLSSVTSPILGDDADPFTEDENDFHEYSHGGGKTRVYSYPDWVHHSLRDKYSAETIHYTLNFHNGQDPLQINQLTDVAVPDLIECLTYMKMFHGEDL